MIVVLMVGGMIGVLRWAKYVLQAAGIVSFAYYHLIKCRKPDWPVVGVIAALIAFSACCFRGRLYAENDTISHWGLVIKYMFRYDQFPDAAADIIFFKSYPLGTACFTYFFGCLRAMPEGFGLAVHFILMAICCMPLLSFAKHNRVLGYLAAGAYLFIAYRFHLDEDSLRVDKLLPLMTVGATAGVLYHRKNILQIAVVVVPVLLSLVYIKSSGAFFAALIAVMATAVAYCSASSGKKRAAAIVLAVAAAAIAIAFFSWNIHVESVFENGHASKHAVSISAYSQNLQNKDDALIRTIATGMLRKITTVKLSRVGIIAVFAAVLVVCRIAARREKELKAAVRVAFVVSVAAVILWYVSLFFMYIFSMPNGEAARLASFFRYESSIFIYILGLAVLCGIILFCSPNAVVFKKLKRIAAVALICVALIGIAGAFLKISVKSLFPKSEASGWRQSTVSLAEKYEINEGKRYLLYTNNGLLDLEYAYYLVKYEYMSNDIMAIINGIETDGHDGDTFYAFTDIHDHQYNIAPSEDVSTTLLDHADQYDYILVLCKDERFEAELDEFLAVYKGDTPVLYAYDR